MMNKKSKFYWASFLLIILFFITMAIYLTTITPKVQGDGHEYIMQTVSFQNHMSFGVNQADLEKAKEQFYNNQERLQTVFDEQMVSDERGWKYSNHYGAYSILVTPVKLFLLNIGVYPVWAFSITNLFLWLSAVLVTFFCLDTDDKKKFCVIFLLIFNPIFFYLDWVHTEMYIFAFEVIGLVFLYNRKYALSILALSLSAMQNLGMLPIAAMAGLFYIGDCYDKYVKKESDQNIIRFIARRWRSIVIYGIFYLPAFFPIIMTYIRFGTYNLVAKVAMEDKYLLHKAVDYLIDPNLGILPYEPIIFVAFVVLSIVGIKRFIRSAILNLVGVAGTLYIIAHQLQINCGMQGIMRYCVWIIPVIIFFVILNWQPKKEKGNGLLLTIILEGIYTATIISYCTWFGGGYSYTQFADWTEALLDIAPQLYNPSHGIFYSRVSGVENYYAYVPMAYINKQGYVRKILVSERAESYFNNGGIRIIKDDGAWINTKDLKGHKIDGGDFTYYNFLGEVRCQQPIYKDLIDTIWFYTDEYNADDYVQNGLSEREDGGVWTDGKRVDMHFKVEDSVPFIDVCIDVGGTFYHPQSVSILINGNEAYQSIIEGDKDIQFLIENPKTDIIALTMLLPDAIAPCDVMESEDPRELGLWLLTMKMTEAYYEK